MAVETVRSPFVAYPVAALVGFLVAPLIVGALWMAGLFYADWIAGYDTKNDRFSELIAASMFAAPLIGLVIGLVVVARRRRRAALRRA